MSTRTEYPICQRNFKSNSPLFLTHPTSFLSITMPVQHIVLVTLKPVEEGQSSPAELLSQCETLLKAVPFGSSLVIGPPMNPARAGELNSLITTELSTNISVTRWLRVWNYSSLPRRGRVSKLPCRRWAHSGSRSAWSQSCGDGLVPN